MQDVYQLTAIVRNWNHQFTSNYNGNNFRMAQMIYSVYVFSEKARIDGLVMVVLHYIENVTRTNGMRNGMTMDSFVVSVGLFYLTMQRLGLTNT